MRKHMPEKTAYNFYLLTNCVSLHITACPYSKAGNRYYTVSGLAIRLSFYLDIQRTYMKQNVILDDTSFLFIAIDI